MRPLELLLLLVLVASALVLVHSSYQTRRLFAELDAARAEERQLATDTERLKAQARHESTQAKIEVAARQKLGMHQPGAQEVLFLADAAPSPAPASAAAATAEAVR